MAESEIDQLWEALFDATPLTVALLDHDRRFRYVNRVPHGFDRRRDVEGQRIDTLLPPADRDRITKLIDEVLRTGEPRTYETRLVTPIGLVLFFVRLNALIVDGAVRYAVLVSFDITEEHEKRKLREREHELLAALDPVNRLLLSAPVAEPTFDRLLGDMLKLFECERAFLGYPCDPKADEFTIVYEQTDPEFPRPKGLTLPVSPMIAERFELALEHPGEAIRHDPECNPIPIDVAEPNPFQVRSMLFAAVDAGQDKSWLLGIHHCRAARVYDHEVPLLAAIAARVGDGLRTWRTQEEMRQSEERFRLLVEHAPEAIVILDVDTAKFMHVNSKACELFGLSREQLLQKGPLDLSPPLQPDGRTSAEHAQMRIAATLAGESPVFEFLHIHASGQIIECEVRLLHLPHPQRRWIRGSMLDITERKRAERENERLSGQLAQAQKMQAIGHLTGGVAHDFNNLLTVIGGSLEMMELNEHTDENVRSYGLMALEACQRAAGLTQRLLAFSRQQPLRPRAINIEQLVRGMEGLLRRTLGETIHIEVMCSTDLWLCEVDPVQLESAILNLSINARDAMPAGGHLTIDACNIVLDASTLRVHDELAPGDYVRISVTDDGVGIPPELLSKVFEPFFTTKEVGKGSGLGLSMVYGFATQSRGQVKIYSELGQGTTVRLFLPRSHGALETAPEPMPAQSAPRGKRELILVVEDDTNLRALTVELLHRLGYRTIAAGHGAGALELLRSERKISLLLADMVLPGGMNGAELARQVHEQLPGVPVLFMSGYTENAVIHNGRLDPGVRLLEKPFSASALANAVRKAIDED
ncbi:MAG TPA: PAS domain S-box protein [Polyangiales bacterium]|nr:PAS domain S-box protein [Polyangiales bacterium]